MSEPTKFQSLIKQLYSITKEMQSLSPHHRVKPDGNMLGGIGQFLVNEAYDLIRITSSNKDYDAITPQGRKVEIKTIGSKSLSVSSCCEHMIVIKLDDNGEFEEIYNGPGDIIWKCFQDRSVTSNRYFRISIPKVIKLNETVNDCDRIPKRILEPA